MKARRTQANASSKVINREFIVDSSASFHLISVALLSKAERTNKRKRAEAISLQYANAPVSRNSDVDKFVSDLVMQQLPTCVSLGLQTRVKFNRPFVPLGFQRQ